MDVPIWTDISTSASRHNYYLSGPPPITGGVPVLIPMCSPGLTLSLEWLTTDRLILVEMGVLETLTGGQYLVPPSSVYDEEWYQADYSTPTLISPSVKQLVVDSGFYAENGADTQPAWTVPFLAAPVFDSFTIPDDGNQWYMQVWDLGPLWNDSEPVPTGVVGGNPGSPYDGHGLDLFFSVDGARYYTKYLSPAQNAFPLPDPEAFLINLGFGSCLLPPVSGNYRVFDGSVWNTTTRRILAPGGSWIDADYRILT